MSSISTAFQFSIPIYHLVVIGEFVPKGTKATSKIPVPKYKPASENNFAFAVELALMALEFCGRFGFQCSCHN